MIREGTVEALFAYQDLLPPLTWLILQYHLPQSIDSFRETLCLF